VYNLFTIETDSALDAWRTVLEQIMESGEEIEDENEDITKELLNVMVTVKDPLNSKAPEGYFTIEKLKRCENQFLDPDNQFEGIDYGNRLRKHFGFKLGRDVYSIKTDQIESVLTRLKRNRTSRRAVLTVFDPSIDHYQDTIPSMMMMDFKIRKNRLYITAIWRGNDVYASWLNNFFALKGLSEYISKSLNIVIGPITIHLVSAYIYKRNYKDVNHLITN
jgi:thymidylate synthase